MVWAFGGCVHEAESLPPLFLSKITWDVDLASIEPA